MSHERHHKHTARLGLVSWVSAAVIVCGAAPARADLVFFESGRAISVKAVRLDDAGALVLTLRGGGEIICDASVIARIAPDEVPYPEPQPPALAAVPIVAPGAYDPIIERAAAAAGVDAQLVKAVIQVESGYQERARSPKGAMGLMQLMPETARRYAVANPYDPRANIEAGIRHLKSLLQRYPLRLALAAYNAGAGAVERFGGIPPYGETQLYVARILKLLGPARS